MLELLRGRRVRRQGRHSVGRVHRSLGHAAELYESCSTAVLVLVLSTAVRELIFSHSYNFYFGREYTLGATIGAMAKFAHVTNRHKFS